MKSLEIKTLKLELDIDEADKLVRLLNAIGKSEISEDLKPFRKDLYDLLFNFTLKS